MISFWLMSGGMVFMTFTLTFAGALQTHLQRVNGEAFMDVQDQRLGCSTGCASVRASLSCSARSFGSMRWQFPRREVIGRSDAQPAPAE